MHVEQLDLLMIPGFHSSQLRQDAVGRQQWKGYPTKTTFLLSFCDKLIFLVVDRRPMGRSNHHRSTIDNSTAGLGWADLSTSALQPPSLPWVGYPSWKIGFFGRGGINFFFFIISTVTPLKNSLQQYTIPGQTPLFCFYFDLKARSRTCFKGIV
jgi:hypothetical protein